MLITEGDTTNVEFCWIEQRPMSALRFIVIDRKRYLWRDILRLRQEQKHVYQQAPQPALFELKHDHCPPAERTAADRYLEPSFFG